VNFSLYFVPDEWYEWLDCDFLLNIFFIRYSLAANIKSLIKYYFLPSLGFLVMVGW
jgi:hypothetical protein